jgi:UDP-2,4-diacetamido-2,4,6-trideoxy-beta-L-altropyranose hydrolase
MNIVIRVDASTSIGSGHLMRCVALATKLRHKGATVKFISAVLPGDMFQILESHGFEYAQLASNVSESQEADATYTQQTIYSLFKNSPDWLIVDHYALDAKWERLLQSQVKKLMVIDDLANRAHVCDMLLDQNYYSDAELRYQHLLPAQCRTFLGPAYLLLRDEFYEARKYAKVRSGNVKRILVFFGSSDTTNQTQTVIESIMQLNRPDIIFDIVVGNSNPNRHKIAEQCQLGINMNFHCQINYIAELMLNADLAIGAGGSAMWERCFLGLPSITVIFASNQERTTKDFSDAGGIHFLGWATGLSAASYLQVIKDFLDQPHLVRELSQKCLNFIHPSPDAVAESILSIDS